MKSDLTVFTSHPHSLPAVIETSGEKTVLRFIDFFTSNIRNPNTRKAYAKNVAAFMAWCEVRGVSEVSQIQPLHVAGFIEKLAQSKSAPTAKQHLAAIRMLFDWLILGQVVSQNPAHAVRGPKHVVKRGKTPVLSADEARQLLDAIDITKPVGLRDRALIGLMVYSFARIGAALAMKVEDVFVQRNRLWVRLHEKGGKRHEMPCHHNLEDYLRDYIAGANLSDDPKGPLFRTIGRKDKKLSRSALPQSNAHSMIRRKARLASIETKIGNHTFRATGITAYLTNGGMLEKAATMANHASIKTTQLYDRRSDDVTLDEIERILI